MLKKPRLDASPVKRCMMMAVVRREREREREKETAQDPLQLCTTTNSKLRCEKNPTRKFYTHLLP